MHTHTHTHTHSNNGRSWWRDILAFILGRDNFSGYFTCSFRNLQWNKVIVVHSCNELKNTIFIDFCLKSFTPALWDQTSVELPTPKPLCRRRQWQPTPVLLLGKSHGQRSLVGCSPWGREESDMTERLHFHFSLSCIGEGNGNPLQCSCLENSRDGGSWWAAV